MNKKYFKYILRTILIVMIIIWMAVIFGFSSADGAESQSASDVITEIVVNVLFDNYDKMQAYEKVKIWDNVSFVVRKIGHFGEYGILTVLVSLFLLTFDIVYRKKKLLWHAVLFGVIYAVTDEIHQGFVAGRSPKAMDVIIDSLGAMTGTAFVGLCLNVKERFCKKNSE